MGSITGWQTCQVRIVSKLILECLVMENMFASQEKRVNDKVSNSKLVLCWPVLVSVYMGLPWQWEEGQASGFPKKNCATKWNQCLKVVKNVLGGRVKKKKKSNSPSKKKKNKLWWVFIWKKDVLTKLSSFLERGSPLPQKFSLQNIVMIWVFYLANLIYMYAKEFIKRETMP